MDIRKGIAPAIALLAMAVAHCGGSDSAPMSTADGAGGSSGAAGSSGSGGGSKAGSSGANVSDGSAQDSPDNSDSAGSGGSSGSDGSTGTAGSMGSGGSAGASSDGAAGSGGAKSDAGAGDAKSDGSVSMDSGDASACPGQAPVNADPCTGSEICTYGDVGCACVKAMGPGREWQCRRIPDAAADSDCPASAPAVGSACVDAGPGTLCRYPGNVFCACDQADHWRCNR